MAVLRIDPSRDAGRREADRAGSPGRFVLYVEGPRDRAILRAWSYRLLPARGRLLVRATVILGGRQPARAIEHFRGIGGEASGARALCVLDRDDSPPAESDEPGLEFFTWTRRHIESYLLVRPAIDRVLGSSAADRRVARALREQLPPEGDETAFRDVDAKRLFGPKGPLPALGRPAPLSRIASATLELELHPDVHALFARLREHLEARAPGK
jgi:hypothetical protein